MKKQKQKQLYVFMYNCFPPPSSCHYVQNLAVIFNFFSLYTRYQGDIDTEFSKVKHCPDMDKETYGIMCP